MAFSKSLPKGQIPVGCQLCKGFDKIVWKCIECNLLMCDGCKTGVHLRIAKDHKIVKIQEIGGYRDPWDSFVFGDVKCQDHIHQSCSLYCKTCSKVICLKCIVKVHNGHTFVDKEEFEEKKETMKDGQKKAERYLSELGSAKEKIVNPENTDCPELRNIRQNIIDEKKKLHKAVDGYADHLVQDVDQYFRSLKHEKETKIENEIKHVHEKNYTLGSIVSSKDFMKFFRDFDKLNVSLKDDLFQEATNMYSLPTFVPGEFKLLNFGSLDGRLRENLSKVEFKVTHQWSTELTDIHHIVVCPDGTLWIADGTAAVLQHINLIKLENPKVKILSSLRIRIDDISVDISSNILLSTSETKLKIIDIRTEQVADSVFDISPYKAESIHITQDLKVIISASLLCSLEKCVVIVIDQAGNYVTEYENDNNSKPLFKSPYKITSTRHGNICVVDTLDKDFRGRVVVIDKAGYTKGIYTGHPDVNTEDNPFTPLDILATSSDNILVADWKISVIHILNSDGNFISFFSAYDIGIQYPHSLALSTPGKLYIGCGSGVESPEHDEAKLYEIEYSGM